MEHIVITRDSDLHKEDEINNFTKGRSCLKVFTILAISLFVLATVGRWPGRFHHYRFLL